MITVSGIVMALLIAIVTGKYTRRIGPGAYVFIALLALALVCAILYDMFTTSYPVP
jgi:hypothetical protein